MELAAYLSRIGFRGEPKPDLATLEAIQRLHLLAIAYENLDVQLGRPSTTAPEAAFDKLVRRRRGGWCYEMNGVMGWALGEVGFKVTRLAGAVMRSAAGDANIGNHLVLRVETPDGPRLADVGLGDGPITPFSIVEGAFTDRGLEFRVERVDDGWWRVHNHALARPPSFDLHLEREDEAALSRKCAWLQADPDSMFVQTLICQRFTPASHVDLIGRVLRTYGPEGVSERLLTSADELVSLLDEQFGIEEPAAADLWPRIVARHDLVFGQASSSMSQ
jgi:N-hydroxyarylamine O-acetyltransferase